MSRGLGDVYKRQTNGNFGIDREFKAIIKASNSNCLLYTSPSPRDTERSRMPSSA
ncbi:hypothetical protein JMUB7552_27430 [Staphylococcus aureus]